MDFKLKDCFGRHAVVKEWQGSDRARKQSETALAPIPETNFSIIAETLKYTGRNLSQRVADTTVSTLVMDRGWDNLSFEVLAQHLEEAFIGALKHTPRPNLEVVLVEHLDDVEAEEDLYAGAERESDPMAHELITPW